MGVYAVHISREQGVWGTSDQTVKLSNKLCASMDPYCKSVKQSLPFDVPELPKKGNLSFLFTHYYNLSVKNTIYVIHRLPCYVGMGIKKTKDAINQALDAPPSKSN